MSVGDDATRLYVSLGRLIRSLRRDSPGSLIGHGSLSALSSLVADGPMRLGELAAAESVSPPSLTRIVASLEMQDLVRRTPDPDDGRAQLVEATAEGRKLVASGRETKISALRARLTTLDANETKLLTDAIELIERLANADDSRPAATSAR